MVSLVAGEPVRGSWWGHPKGHDIFAACQHLLQHPDATTAKLVSGKVTYVHRELWPSLLAVATAGEDWQTEGLPESSLAIWRRVEEEGSLRSERLNGRSGEEGKELSARVRELERRLLLHTTILHSETGKHVKVVESWTHWTERVGKKRGLGGRPRVAKARDLLEVVLAKLNERYGAKGRLPWQ